MVLKVPIRDKLKRPHVRAILYTVIVFVVAGGAAIALYERNGAVSSILASISAGCITGIVFYMISNLRNNEIRATKDEYEELEKHYQLARQTTRLCVEALEQENRDIETIKSNMNKLMMYMGCLFIDEPKTSSLVKKVPEETKQRYYDAVSVLTNATAVDENASEEALKEYLRQDISFCSAIQDLLLEPLITMMYEISNLEGTSI